MPQLALRLSDEDHDKIRAAAARAQETDDPNVSAYVREAALAATSAGGDMARALARYREIVLRSRPRLTPAEWRLICDACNGVWLTADSSAALAVTGIPYEVADGIRLSALDRKHGVEGAPLVAKLTAMPFADLAAVAEVVERFWASDSAAVPGEPEWKE